MQLLHRILDLVQLDKCRSQILVCRRILRRQGDGTLKDRNRILGLLHLAESHAKIRQHFRILRLDSGDLLEQGNGLIQPVGALQRKAQLIRRGHRSRIDLRRMLQYRNRLLILARAGERPSILCCNQCVVGDQLIRPGQLLHCPGLLHGLARQSQMQMSHRKVRIGLEGSGKRLLGTGPILALRKERAKLILQLGIVRIAPRRFFHPGNRGWNLA